MAFMRSAHEENILCRVVCNRRTIVQQMPMNATPVTRLTMKNTLLTQGLRENFLKNIFCVRSLPRVRSSAGGEASRKREKTGLRAAGLSRSLFVKREAGQPPAYENMTGGLPCDC